MRQEKRVWLAGVTCILQIIASRGDQALIMRCRGPCRDVGIAHHPLGDALGIHTTQRGQRARDQQTRHAHPKTASDQFDEHQLAGAIQLLQQWQQLRNYFVRRSAAQGQQAIFHPQGKAFRRCVLRQW